jgi:hypothetical protein
MPWRDLLRGLAFIAGAIVLAMASWYALGFGEDGSMAWAPLLLVAVVMLFRGVWEWWRVDTQLAIATVLFALSSALFPDFERDEPVRSSTARNRPPHGHARDQCNIAAEIPTA